MGFPINKSRNIVWEKPVDRLTDNAIDFTNDGATCSFKVYSTNEESVLIAVVSSGVTLSVADAGKFTIGEICEIEQDDSIMHDGGAITAIDTTANTVGITNAITATCGIDRRVRTRLGNSINMLEFGEAKIGSARYGFLGILAWNHPGLKVGKEIEIRKIFIFGAIHITDSLCGIVVDNCIDV
ncbi:hypothetical protein LCGC14_0615850 [marine sediment metagenome]|uniref:Uncharacterized protein n=1 Tax=marine sediment metagenome TaxID=412755 RepID=A0A0F9TSK6_9ZZZZ